MTLHCKAWCFPLWSGLLLGVVIFGSYIWALVQGHVDPWLPFISEAGATLPESGVFTALLAVESFLGAICVLLRYRLVGEYADEERASLLRFFNGLSLIFGLVASLGILILAAYPVTSMEVVHQVGAGLAFYIGVLYLMLQSIVTLQTYPDMAGKCTCFSRMLLTIGAFIFAVLLASYREISYQTDDDDIAARARIIAAGMEWGLVLSVVFFFLTFMAEFHDYYVEMAMIAGVPHAHAVHCRCRTCRLTPSERSYLLSTCHYSRV